MLPDFPLAIAGFDPPRCVLAQDVPASAFFYGFPGISGEMVPPDIQIAQEQEARTKFDGWADGLLSRVILLPRLTPELVQRLGAARSSLVWAYLSAVGWLTEGDPNFVELASGGELLVAASATAPDDPQHRIYERIRWMTAPAPPGIRDQMLKLAEHASVLPSVVWHLPISEYLWSWRAICDEAVKR